MLLTKEHFKVGQIVACKHAGNKARYNKGFTLGKVCKVGKKIVTVAFNEDEKNTIQFVFEESYERDYLQQKSNYSGNYELFPSEKDYLEHEEKHEKLSKIQTSVSTFYNSCKLNIDQVRRIYEIINE